MSAQANFFKLGLFVIAGTVALVLLLLVLGSGRWFQSKVVIETYFNESVQGLDVGSKVKYRGVNVGEVTRITFTYTKYQLDRPADERLRYVLVEATVLPRLIGSRAGGDITKAETAAMEIEKGLRVRLAPQGITGTNYLEIDYADPKTNPQLPISWVPDYLYIPSAPSTVTQFVNAAGDIADRLHKLDVEGTIANLNKLLTVTNDRIAAIDTARLTQQSSDVLGKLSTKLDQLPVQKLGQESTQLIAELRQTNQKLSALLSDPAWQKLPGDASAAVAAARKLAEDPNLPKAIAHIQQTLSRLDRVIGGGSADLSVTLENLRQITDNLRDLTEDAKRNPSRLLRGEPPLPVGGKR
jgi:ABC-type transporter Mla subunit MlaD